MGYGKEREREGKKECQKGGEEGEREHLNCVLTKSIFSGSFLGKRWCKQEADSPVAF